MGRLKSYQIKYMQDRKETYCGSTVSAADIQLARTKRLFLFGFYLILSNSLVRSRRPLPSPWYLCSTHHLQLSSGPGTLFHAIYASWGRCSEREENL
jgi:hypothetical protein